MADNAAPAGIADLHVHTHRSDGSDSPLQVLHWAKRIGLDILAITDHDTIDGALEAQELALRLGCGPEVIVGEEVSSADGHVLGLFLANRIEPGLTARETVAAIHEQGGLAVAAHPYWRVGATARNGSLYSVGDLFMNVAFDAVEVTNGGFTPAMVAANIKAGRLARELELTEIGGSDAHVKHALGWAHTRFPGRTARDLRAAMCGRETRAGRSRLGFAGVRRYTFWSIGRFGLEPVAS